MQRVVVDTNIFISAYLFGGLPGWFVRAGISRHFAILTSEADFAVADAEAA